MACVDANASSYSTNALTEKPIPPIIAPPIAAALANDKNCFVADPSDGVNFLNARSPRATPRSAFCANFEIDTPIFLTGAENLSTAVKIVGIVNLADIFYYLLFISFTISATSLYQYSKPRKSASSRYRFSILSGVQ